MLVGEADVAKADVLATILRGRGYEAVVERNQQALLARLDSETFDVVILAWALPGATGLDLLRRVRARHAMPDLPVMMMSCRDESEKVVQAFDRGANDFLRTPLDPAVTLVRVHNLVALRRARVALRQQAMVDPLTNIYNRRYIMQQIASQTAVARRYGRPLAFCLCDIDHFKRVNDDYGHRIGDEALRRVASVLRTRLRRSDVVGRFGGDELCIVFPETSAADAAIAAEAVRVEVAESSLRIPDTDRVVRITASLGIAEIGDGMHDSASLVCRADEALYRSKERGRNTTTVWQPTPTIAATA